MGVENKKPDLSIQFLGVLQEACYIMGEFSVWRGTFFASKSVGGKMDKRKGHFAGKIVSTRKEASHQGASRDP